MIVHVAVQMPMSAQLTGPARGGNLVNLVKRQVSPIHHGFALDGFKRGLTFWEERERERNGYGGLVTYPKGVIW